MSEKTTLYFLTCSARDTVEAFMSLPNIKADILGGLDFYSKVSGELIDEMGNNLVWEVSTKTPGKIDRQGLAKIEYNSDKEYRPSRWLMILFFELLDMVEAQLITEQQYLNSERP